MNLRFSLVWCITVVYGIVISSLSPPGWVCFASGMICYLICGFVDSGLGNRKESDSNKEKVDNRCLTGVDMMRSYTHKRPEPDTDPFLAQDRKYYEANEKYLSSLRERD